MARKRPKVNLKPAVPPQTGEMDKLFTAADDVEQAAGMQLLAIRIDTIQPDPLQPRRTFPGDSLKELSTSIQQDGVIQPIEVTEIRKNTFVIVHGERRWRAAHLAGLETIPAVVRRRDYDEVTRFVRQLVENIQREDLNDVDRAAGLLRLRDLLQEELEKTKQMGDIAEQPWGSKITWSKVGQRLGYTRQRIHQLIQLLNLPDEVKDDVRDGRISERDTRIYQGLKPSQVRALHKARLARDVSTAEAKAIARILKKYPDQTVYQTIRTLRLPEETADVGEISYEELDSISPSPLRRPAPSANQDPSANDSLTERSPSGTPVTNITRLSYIQQHLARIQTRGFSKKDEKEVLRLLRLIEGELHSLIAAIEAGE